MIIKILIRDRMEEKNMRIIDAEKLLKEIKKLDLSYMQQADVLECLEYVINKQPTVSEEICSKK